jgi:dimethylhistidine N-methyltransferase
MTKTNEITNKNKFTLTHCSFQSDVMSGLSGLKKTLPCRWLYDNIGSELFEAITRVPEYYPTRTETVILQTHIREIADFAGQNAILIEYGAGAGIKTETLIAALRSLACYIPVDIAGEFLEETACRIRGKFPQLSVQPVVSDFMSDFALPTNLPGARRVAFFPGSTIGNLSPKQAGDFLRRMRNHVGPEGAAIIGFDLKKDVETMISAYDDRAGVTSKFNLNLLTRINRELEGNFELSRFRHSARWNEEESAMEMHIVSLEEQIATVGMFNFHFRAGETIHTESSRKYDVEGFARLADANGWKMDRIWRDSDNKFGIAGMR